MIRIIFNQIWNQRRQNLWIWLELAVLSAFLWIVIDPLFTMLCLKQTPCGFDRDRIYLIRPVYDDFGKAYQNVSTDPTFAPRMDNMLTMLEAHPMVEAVCLGSTRLIPGGLTWNGSIYYPNLAEAKKDLGKPWEEQDHYTHAQWFIIPHITGLEKWIDVTYTLGLRDAFSGEYVHVRPDALMQRLTYISAGMANRLYGTPNVKDSTVFNNNTEDPSLGTPEVEHGRLRKIDAVFANVKGRDFETPYPNLFEVNRCDNTPIYSYGALVRLKEGTDGEVFMENVQHDVLKHCSADNIARFEVVWLARQMDQAAEKAGANNVVRLQGALGFFGLLCVFLGVSGLFWVRCGERRQDIGVMRSLGATRRMVNRQMLAEGVILLSLAFLAAMLFVAWYVHKYGYNAGLSEQAVNWNGPDMSYWFNRPVPHVLSVTLITYALMLFITLIATWIPVHRAIRILPGDALRDE